MLKRNKKLLTALLIASLGSTLFVGCAKKGEEANNGQKGAENNAPVNVTYPIKTDKTLKVWMQLVNTLATTEKSFGDAPIAKELEKKTGVKVEYIHPAQGQEKEQFNLLLASGDMPDIIEYQWYAFPGGPEKAIKDGYILKLNDLMDKYAPDFKKYMQENREVDKMVKTDSGSYYEFPFIRGHEDLMVSFGPIIRKDWLDELGLPIPTTIDQWYTTLKAFKEKKGATAPLSLQMVYLRIGTFSGAFGVTKDIYIDNGKVKFGPMEPGYKDFLATFRKWYAEGLLDKNMATLDAKILDSNMTADKSGATNAFAGSGLGKWIIAGKQKNPNYNLVGAPYPTLKEGQTPEFGSRDLPFSTSWESAISATSKNKELAAMWLNYGYSEAGRMTYNFGTEGVSYNMENGYPKYTDLIMRNPNKLPVANAMARNIRANYGGPFVQDVRYLEQYMETKEQKDAIQAWKKTNAAKHLLPRVTLTPEESSEAAKIINEVNTYADEMFLKFIMGVEPMENYDKYIEQLKKLGIEKYLTIQQTALDRYNKR
jgi:putative aldouronate transport system substrate-binding protein